MFDKLPDLLREMRNTPFHLVLLLFGFILFFVSAITKGLSLEVDAGSRHMVRAVGLGLILFSIALYFVPPSTGSAASPTPAPGGFLATPTLNISISENTRPPAPTNTRPPAPTPVPPPGAGTTQRRGNDNAEMVFVPAGEFTMGSTDQQVNDAIQQLLKDCPTCSGGLYESEKPVHRVTLDAFWIDRYEVRNALYKQCVDAGKCSPPNPTSSATRNSYYGNSQFDNYPVVYVSWNDASAYCAWAGKRLPTEAEWEKAARGTDGRVNPWGNTFDANRLNSYESGPRDTTAVGSYPSGASPYGAQDMAGNVWEWVADWYADYANSPSQNPKGPASGQGKVLRGGGWYLTQSYTRAAYRYLSIPTNRSNSIGFRCAQ